MGLLQQRIQGPTCFVKTETENTLSEMCFINYNGKHDLAVNISKGTFHSLMWLTIVQCVVYLRNLCSLFPCKKIIQAWWLLSYTLFYYIVIWNLGDRDKSLMRNLLHVNSCVLHLLCPWSMHFPWLVGHTHPRAMGRNLVLSFCIPLPWLLQSQKSADI